MANKRQNPLIIGTEHIGEAHIPEIIRTLEERGAKTVGLEIAEIETKIFRDIISDRNILRKAEMIGNLKRENQGVNYFWYRLFEELLRKGIKVVPLCSDAELIAFDKTVKRGEDRLRSLIEEEKNLKTLNLEF